MLRTLYSYPLIVKMINKPCQCELKATNSSLKLRYREITSIPVPLAEKQLKIATEIYQL